MVLMTAPSRRLKVYFKMIIIFLLLKNIELTFPSFTQDVFLLIEDSVPLNNMIIEYEYSKLFQISVGNYIVKIG